ncbi:MAG: class I SAM-dependent methyltransferase [Phycisphaeraceae bacterium]|nr:class I SAM-dependent methyltransferase [Phycisphaeraceae bacterium]MCW5762006.1 class I SAM-dependent methyltransferase [Phycisphaeraceae bacterium]
MKRSTLDFLRDPQTGKRLELQILATHGDEITEGILSAGQHWYPIIDGVPRLLFGAVRDHHADFIARHNLADRFPDESAPAPLSTQAATNVTFSDKWRRFKNYGFEQQHQQFLSGWFVKKFGLQSADQLPAFYRAFDRILEIGPGSGFNTQFMAQHCPGSVVSVDISEAAVTTYHNVGSLPNTHILQADLMAIPCEDNVFDFAIADGVLHHTPNTRNAVEAVYKKVKPGGQFFFYVYRQMGAARRFCDAHLRTHLSPLEPEACYEACEGITELGRELSKLDATITLEKGIPLLGIPPGTHNVQRLLYYNFLKCFWNDAFDWETNNMVNFDWYHPHDAWQHTDDEVRSWLADLGVTQYSFNDANPNGISVLLRKPL